MSEFPQISEFIAGQTVTTFLYVQSKNEKVTKAGEPYLDLTFCDSSGTIPAKIWANVLKNMDADTIDGAVKVQGQVDSYKDRPQLSVKKIRPVTDADCEDGFQQERLFETSEHDAEAMFSHLMGFLDKVANEPLKEMMKGLLQDLREPLLQHTASRSLHHAYFGGLLEHTLSVVHTSVYFAEKYGLDMDIIICGSILHDLAKMREITPDPKRDYTLEGRLVGHVVMGRDVVREYASKFEGLDPETILHLEHIILSHQGEKEWSAPVVPQTPEAMAIHFADNTDAKMEMFKKTILDGAGKGDDFQYHRMLERYIYKNGPSDFQGRYPFF